jgi:hypothetical protein
MWHSTSNGLSDPSVCSSSYHRQITMVRYVGLCVVSPVSRMTTATDREYLDSLTASRKKRLKGKLNLKRSLLNSFVVTLTVLSLLELDSSVAFVSTLRVLPGPHPSTMHLRLVNQLSDIVACCPYDAVRLSSNESSLSLFICVTAWVFRGRDVGNVINSWFGAHSSS